MRISSSPSRRRVSPMLSVHTRTGVERKRHSHSSMASQRSSIGVRFQRWQMGHTTQSRPFAASKAKRTPTRQLLIVAFAPNAPQQKRQWENMPQYGHADTGRTPTLDHSRRGFMESESSSI